MKKITLSEYNSISEAYRGVWTTERWDIPDWAEMRKKHIGKRTMMVYDNGTCLLVEGLGFEIVDDSSWKKPDEVRKEIGSHYLKFYTEKGCEPHYADCVIRWNDTLETEEARIAWYQHTYLHRKSSRPWRDFFLINGAARNSGSSIVSS